MDIVEVSRRSGLPASALRYYEQKGLIASVGRDGLRRRFAPTVLDRLALVALGQAAGFSLDEIAGMFGVDGRPSIDRALLSAKADDIDHTVKRMRAMSRGLRHAAVCPAKNHMECPTFQKLVRAAGEGALKGEPVAPVRKKRQPAAASSSAPPPARAGTAPAAARSVSAGGRARR